MREVVEIRRANLDVQHQQRDRDREHAVAERLDAAGPPVSGDLVACDVAHREEVELSSAASLTAGTRPAIRLVLNLIALIAPVAPAWKANPIASRITPMITRPLTPSIRIPIRPRV